MSALKKLGAVAIASALSVTHSFALVGIDQEQMVLTPGTSGTWNADWPGETDRTYFLQYSLDLVDWHFFPVIEHGTTPTPYGFSSTSEAFFVRLKYADDSTTDPENDDFDGDGLSNIVEVTSDTDPLMWDTDGDGLDDAWELANHLDPRDNGSIDPANGADGDPDDDGLSNSLEFQTLADPQDPDSDDDDLTDGDEYHIYKSSPIYADLDGDTLDDYDEVITYGTNPNLADSDKDTLSDPDELFTYFTDPMKVDTDGDWMWDDWELAHAPTLDPTDPADGLLDSDGDGLANKLEFVFMDKGYNPFVSNPSGFPWNVDHDLDGLTTLQEFTVVGTNPRLYDSDRDRMGDGWERATGFDPVVNNNEDGDTANDADADPDGDELTNEQEGIRGTKPDQADSDGDLVPDAVEIEQGTNPNDANDKEPPARGVEKVYAYVGDHSESQSEKYRLVLTPLEGDTAGERSFVNSSYGGVQPFIVTVAKGSKFRIKLEHVDTDPDYHDEPRPDYDYTLYFSNELSCILWDDPQGIIGSNDGDDTFFAEGKEATLYVPWVSTKAVTYTGSAIGPLARDNRAIYSSPQWLDGNEDGDVNDGTDCKFPIAYVSGETIKIEGKIMVKPSGLTGLAGFASNIKVHGLDPFKVDSIAGVVAVADEIRLTESTLGTFPESEVKFYPAFPLTWSVEIGGHWLEAGNTFTRTYVTLEQPVTSKRQETLFDIGCRAASGETTSGGSFTKIWADFKDRNVKKVNPITGDRGIQMTYYGDWNVNYSATDDLVEYADGQCGSWAHLFLDVLKVQGRNQDKEYVTLTALNTSGVPVANEQFLGFLVADWTFSGSGVSGDLYFPFLALVQSGGFHNSFEFIWDYSDVEDVEGTPGQGIINPKSYFNNHQLVILNGRYYDPSYGTEYDSLQEIDDAAIAGYTYRANYDISEKDVGLDLNGDGDEIDAHEIRNGLGIRNNTTDLELDEEDTDY